jgi:hypothetical protein
LASPSLFQVIGSAVIEKVIGFAVIEKVIGFAVIVSRHWLRRH